MSDKKILFVQYCAKDFLDGTALMDNDAELAYRRICDAIYASNAPLPDTENVKHLTKMGNKWKKVRKALIEDYKKIQIIDGKIHVEKCEKTLQKSAVNIAQKSDAGKRSAQKRKSLKNKETHSTVVATDVPTNAQTTEPTSAPTGEATNRKPYKKENIKRKKETQNPRASEKHNSSSQANTPDQRGAKPTPKDQLWFDGQVIRLNKADFKNWHAIHGGTERAFETYLLGRDKWFQGQSQAIQSRYFMSTLADLKRNFSPQSTQNQKENA